MSGHSKWATIHRKKGLIDQQRGKVFQKLAKEIMVAAKGGSPDPSQNAALRLAVDKANPIINKLINHFPQIILTKNSLEKDISILSNAYNIIGSMSSFLTTLLIINENLKNFWEYDNYRLSQKYLHLHHDIYQYPINFTIYKMKSSLQYMKAMFPWRSNKEQIDLMLNEKCNNKFEVFENNGNY